MAKVLHASYSGYFPSCLNEFPELATQSLEDAMTIYWRVKSWTITITSTEFPISPRTFTSTAPDEAYLVCDNSGVFGNGFSPNDENGFFFLNGFYVNSYASPTLYGVVPQFLIRDDFTEYGSPVDEFSVLVGSYTVFGQSYPLYRTNDEGDDSPASGTIEPASYWPYTD
jgi:hypothetical protein